MRLYSLDDGGAYTTASKGLSSLGKLAFQLNVFFPKYGAVFIWQLKMPSENPSGGTSATAIANVFAAQTKWRNMMSLFEID